MARVVPIAFALVGLTVGSAVAQAPPPPPDCSALIKQVRDGVGNRFDDAGYRAKGLAAEAEKLHNDKKPAECVAKVQEAAKVAGMTVK